MRLLAWLALAGCHAATPSVPPTQPSPEPVASTSATAVAPGPSVAMPTPTATELAGEIAAMGLDPAALPPLNKVPPEQLRKLMPLFAKSLGVKCAACHDFDHPQEKTRRQRTAEFMWSHFLRAGFAVEDKPIFCDSCHHGSLHVLDRSDKKRLGEWMDTAFVKTLGAPGCPTCHGEPFHPQVLNR